MIEVSELPISNVVKFRPPHGPHLQELIQQKPLSVLLDDEDWDLTVRRFQQMIENGSIQAIQALKIRSFKVRWGISQRILPSIRQIHFPCLQNLYLNGNCIRDIEALTALDLRCLQVANLKENNITNLKALRKCNFPSLRELNLYKNNIIDFRPLQELNAPQLVCLWTAPQIDCFVAQQPSTWIFKLSSLPTRLYIRHPGGKNLDFESVKDMVQALQPRVELVYRIQDDISARLQ